jgi:hypothetical protein
MGCDIHLHVEVKIEGKWQNWTAPNLDRNYDLFAKMADVRNYNQGTVPISKPKGLPEDISVVTKLSYDHWGVDGHSHSWLGYGALTVLEEWINNQEHLEGHRKVWEFDRMFGWFLGNGFLDKGSWPDGVDDVRFVFWFDN